MKFLRTFTILIIVITTISISIVYAKENQIGNTHSLNNNIQNKNRVVFLKNIFFKCEYYDIVENMELSRKKQIVEEKERQKIKETADNKKTTNKKTQKEEKKTKTETVTNEKTETDEKKEKQTAFNIENNKDVNYKIIVDSSHPFDESWYSQINIVENVNRYGTKHKVEEKTHEAFLALQQDLLNDGICIEIDSALRTMDDDLRLRNRFVEQYGEGYVATYMAAPGTSDHLTGLSIDLCIDKDGVCIDENDDMLAETEIFEKIHSKIANYGFVLSYPQGKSCTYEPWHIRYIGDIETAKYLRENNIAIFEYF